MNAVLIIFFLSIQSSYSENSEQVASDTQFDTVQFYSANGKSWRIRTYAKDQDVHIWSLGEDIPDLVAVARANTGKHYRDVVREEHVITTAKGLDGLRRGLKERGLAQNLELPPSGAVFWAPEGTRYRTKSAPK